MRHLLIAFFGVLLFIPAYLLAQYMVSKGWATSLFPQTVLWSLLPYMFAAHLLYRTIHVPDAEQLTLLMINTLLPYLVLILGFALLQQRYSRGAVLLVASLTTLWFWVSAQTLQKREKLQLLVLDEETLTELKSEIHADDPPIEDHVELIVLNNTSTIPLHCDGVLVSNVHQLSSAQEKQLAYIKQSHVRLYSVAAIAESLTGRKSLHVLRNPMWQPDGNPAYDTFKRSLDLTIVLITAPAWIPLGILVAIAIKLDSKGPSLFSQTRTGLYGRPFRIWKFRTMVPAQNAQAQFAQANDKRITRLGQFLRKSRLDEIPQLFNVLAGHMSLIGPRPEQHTFVNDFATTIPSYPYRHLVRPGITGWAQVIQGYAANQAETEVKLSYDLYYVSHYSLALDLLIVAKTVRTVLTGFGAR